MMLGSAAVADHEQRRYLRKCELQTATCELTTTPPDLLGSNPTLKDVLQRTTGDAKGIGIKGGCCVGLPPSLNLLEACGEI